MGAAWALHEAGDPAAEDRVAVKALAVLAGDSDRAAQEIAAEAGAAGLKGSRRTGIDACIRYLTGKREFLRYDQALQDGGPIATGVIEGACRHLIADRLNLGGARWGLDGAEAVLTLRAVMSNGDFPEYWRFHLRWSTSGFTPALSRDNTCSAPDWSAHSSGLHRPGFLPAVRGSCHVLRLSSRPGRLDLAPGARFMIAS